MGSHGIQEGSLGIMTQETTSQDSWDLPGLWANLRREVKGAEECMSVCWKMSQPQSSLPSCPIEYLLTAAFQRETLVKTTARFCTYRHWPVLQLVIPLVNSTHPCPKKEQ